MPELHLESKPDAQRSMERWIAWWNCEIIDRPPVTLSLRPSGPWTLPSKHHATVRDAWMDVEFVVERFAALVRQQEYIADSLPTLFPNLGPEVMACLFGAEMEYSESSGWSIPCFESCRQVMEKAPEWDNPVWQAVEKLIDLSTEQGRGKWITGFTDMHTNGDLLAALRDPEELCIECLDDPEAVRQACEYVTPICIEAYDRQVSKIMASGSPVCTWLEAPSWYRMFVPNCDFNALISVPMFTELVMPSIHDEVRAMDHTIFHLDGPTALKHLDAVLEIPGLNALQWVYGAGNEPAAKWVDVYRKAQNAGKANQVVCVDMEDARRVMAELPARGVWLAVGGAYDRDVAEGFLKEVEQWAARTA